jgi:hypothetical protein
MGWGAGFVTRRPSAFSVSKGPVSVAICRPDGKITKCASERRKGVDDGKGRRIEDSR